MQQLKHASYLHIRVKLTFSYTARAYKLVLMNYTASAYELVSMKMDLRYLRWCADLGEMLF
jgi:hypothetical protein